MGLGLRGRGRRSVEHAVGFPGQNKLEGNLVYNWLARVRTAGTNEWWTVYSDIGPNCYTGGLLWVQNSNRSIAVGLIDSRVYYL